MENIKTQVALKNSPTIHRKIFLTILTRFQKGEITIRFPEGDTVTIGEGHGIKCDIQIHSEDFFKRCVLFADIGFAEAYIDGQWTTSNLTKIVRWAIQNRETSGIIGGSKIKSMGINFLGSLNRFTHLLKTNTFKNSKSNISYHYDLSNDFYKLMLDETMNYSCAIFNNKEDDLFKAQEVKLRTLCEDLDLKSTDHVLEIGCGWGGFACYAATHYGCRVTGITISRNQFEFAKKRVKNLNLEDKVEIVFQDYRELDGKYSKIVSVEMIEAVGHEYLPTYFKKISDLLAPEGLAVIQAITSPDCRYDSLRNGVDFIQKHIFPGSLLPSISAITSATSKSTDLHLFNLRDIGLHYAETLRRWQNNFLGKLDEIRNLPEINGLGQNKVDDTFVRLWTYYLCYCEAAFEERHISTVQMTFTKPNNPISKRPW